MRGRKPFGLCQRKTGPLARRTERKKALAQQQAESDQTAKLLKQQITKTLITLEDPTSDTASKYRAAASIFHTCIWDKAAGTVRLVYRWHLPDL